MSEPTFVAAKIKLDLSLKFASKPSKLVGWLFEMEQYCDIVGIVKPADKVRLAASRLEHDAYIRYAHLIELIFSFPMVFSLCQSDIY